LAWSLAKDKEQSREYTRRTCRGSFTLSVLRGHAGVCLRLHRFGHPDRLNPKTLFRFSHTSWEEAEGFVFPLVEGYVTHELEELAELAESLLDAAPG